MLWVLKPLPPNQILSHASDFLVLSDPAFLAWMCHAFIVRPSRRTRESFFTVSGSLRTRIQGRADPCLVCILHLRTPALPGFFREVAGEMQLKQAMTQNPHTVSLSSTANEIAILMAEFGVSSIAVVREGRPIGLVRESDLVRKVVAKGLEPRQALAQDLMDRRIIQLSEDDEIEKAVVSMRRYQSSEVLVCAPDGILRGTFNLADLARVWNCDALGEVVQRMLQVGRQVSAPELAFSPASN